MKTIQDYKTKYNQLGYKKNLSGKEALEAVKQDGYALQYVNSNIFGLPEEKKEEIVKIKLKDGQIIKGILLKK